MLTLARDHWLRSKRSSGNGRSAVRSMASNSEEREPSRLRKGLALTEVRHGLLSWADFSAGRASSGLPAITDSEKAGVV
jgi:hypothetical protein